MVWCLDEIHEHTHAPSLTKCQATKGKAGIKERIEETTQQILGTELRNISDGVAANLPSPETLRRNVRHSCQDRNMPPTLAHREDIPDLPPTFRTTTNGDLFLVYDSGVGDEERIFIFASQGALQFLADSEHWYADGTFRVCVEIFFQLYTVYGQRDGRIFPCVFSLLPNKNENTYNRLFEQLFQLVNDLGNGPNDVLVDFDRSAINAFQNLNIEVQGCFYRLSANIWKHTQHLGFSQRYNQEEEFTLYIKMLPALAFLPAGDVIEGFEELVDTIRILYDDVADDLLQYFEETYIRRYRRNAPRRRPLFAINLWNMFNRTDDELSCTNDSAEGWHQSFQGHVSICHPVFWKFFSILQKEENMIRISIVQHLAEHPAPPPRPRYLDSSRRILRLLDDYPNRQRLQYLRAIAHNLIF